MYKNEKSPDDMIKILPSEMYLDALAFVCLGKTLDCKAETRYAHSNKYWRCVYSRKRPSRVLFTIECTEDWWRVKACLWSIDNYRNVLTSCGEKIRETIKKGYNCKSCNSHCKGGAAFTFENIEYRKCVGCCFYFTDLAKRDQADLLRLISAEHDATNPRA